MVYTPYLTAAVDARQQANDGNTPTVAQGMKVAKQYDGVLALGLNLSTSVKLEPKNLKVKLYQGRMCWPVCEPELRQPAGWRRWWTKRAATCRTPMWGPGVLCQYFDLMSKVNPAKPMVMNAYDEYGGTRQFV